jgi:hypothetical protein
MTTPPNENQSQEHPERLSRRQALRDAARLGLILYAAPCVLSSEPVLAQTISAGGGTVPDPGPGFDNTLPLVGFGVGGLGAFLGSLGGGSAVSGAAGAPLPMFFLGQGGLPGAGPLSTTADSQIPNRPRISGNPRPSRRAQRSGAANRSPRSGRRPKRAIRGLG